MPACSGDSGQRTAPLLADVQHLLGTHCSAAAEYTSPLEAARSHIVRRCLGRTRGDLGKRRDRLEPTCPGSPICVCVSPHLRAPRGPAAGVVELPMPGREPAMT